MNKTKQLVQGALFVAIYGVFFLISRFLGGMLESFCFFLLPLPIAIFTFNYGFKKAFIPYIAIGILGILWNPISTIFYVLTANVLGVVYGEMMRRDKSKGLRLVACIITSMIVNTLTMYIFAGLFDYSIQDEISLIFGYILKLLGAGIDDAMQMQRLVLTAIPVFIFFVGAVEGYLIDVSGSYIFKRLKLRDSFTEPLLFLLLPRWVSFLYIPIILLYVCTAFVYLGTTDIWLIIFGSIGFNLFWIATLVLALQGIVSSQIFCIRKNIRYVFVFILFAGIIFVSIYFLLAMAIIGFGVVISDYHRHLLYNK